jgi:hypothetical protein
MNPLLTKNTVPRALAASLLLGSILFAPVASAQASRKPVNRSGLSAPVLGYVPDSGSGYRPLWGIPGSAVIGPALDLQGLTRFTPLPDQDSALAISGDSGQLVLIQQLSSTPIVTPIEGMESGASLIALSPRGTSAAVIFPVSNRLAVLSGLDGVPAVSWTSDLPNASTQPLIFAISDDGQAVLISGADSALLLAARDAAPVALPELAGISAAVFLPNSTDALLADSTGNRILLARNIASAPSYETVANADDGLSAPLFVASTPDRAFLLAAAENQNGLFVKNLKDGTSTTLNCGFTPTSLRPLRGNAAFLLKDAPNETAWLVEIREGRPRLLFIPPVSSTEGGAQ